MMDWLMDEEEDEESQSASDEEKLDTFGSWCFSVQDLCDRSDAVELEDYAGCVLQKIKQVVIIIGVPRACVPPCRVRVAALYWAAKRLLRVGGCVCVLRFASNVLHRNKPLSYHHSCTPNVRSSRFDKQQLSNLRLDHAYLKLFVVVFCCLAIMRKPAVLWLCNAFFSRRKSK